MNKESAGNENVSVRDDTNNYRDRSIEYLVQSVEDPTTRNYIEERLFPQMKFYSSMSRKYKKQYQAYTSMTIILGALIPVGTLFLQGDIYIRIMIATLGSAVTAINAYLALYNSKDLWLTYRNTREVLLRTLYYYFNDAEMFSKKESTEEKNRLLIEVCESELARENGTWRSMMEK